MRSSVLGALAWTVVGLVALSTVLATLLAASGGPHAAMAFLGDWRVWLVAAAALVCGLAAARIIAGSLAHRIGGLKEYSDRILDAPLADPELFRADDELGVLGRSMSRVPPRVHELVQRVSLESQRREAILAGMVEALLAVDQDLRVVFCNDAFARVAGVPGGVGPGTSLVRIVRDPALVDLLREALGTGRTAQRRLQLGSSEGPWFEVNVAPLAMPAGRGAIALLHDITELERLERIRKDFVANVSHELRTPLTAIRGYAETLLDGALEDAENRRRFVEVIETHAIRLNNIAADLLALSELDNGYPTEQPRPVQVLAAVESALRTVEPVAGERRVRLVSEVPADLEILGHRMRLEQALVNLTDNAVKFNRPDGEVRVQAERANGCVRIVVSDTGIGIPSSDLPRIFERFYRVDRARSREMGGTGLGLSIVKHAVEQMKGTVNVESELGKGSRFILMLPTSRQSSL